MNINDMTEAFRKAMLDVLVPEIKELQKGQVELKGEVSALRQEMHERFASVEKELVGLHEGQKAILDKLDFGVTI